MLKIWKADSIYSIHELKSTESKNYIFTSAPAWSISCIALDFFFNLHCIQSVDLDVGLSDRKRNRVNGLTQMTLDCIILLKKRDNILWCVESRMEE